MEYYEKFKEYVYDNLDTMFYPCHQDDYVWGLYFVLWTKMEQVDAVFSSMHFERIYLKKDYYHGTPQKIYSEYEAHLENLNREYEKYQEKMKNFSSMHFERIYLKKDYYHGTPQKIYSEYEAHLENLNREYEKYQEKMKKLLEGDASLILSAQAALNALSTNFDVRKVAACVKEHQETFYILCGWMTQKDALAFTKEIENDTKLFCIIEDDKNKISSTPPTKLKNPKIFKPFEMYVKMYGLPDYHEIDPTIFVALTYSFIFGASTPPTKLKNPKIFKPFEMYVKMYGLPDYHEIDPTIFVALTYSFIFGAMFGDVGQGLLLVIGGFLLYKIKHMNLAAIIGIAGIFSTFFGFMFGSIFGFEDIIDAVWLRPVEAMTLVPGLGNMNTVFVVAIVFGMFLILTTMIFHIINAVRSYGYDR